jgi:hypothetical protein
MLLMKLYSEKEAAGVLGISEVELDCYTGLGWVKCKVFPNGEKQYTEIALDKFATEILLPLEEKFGL